MRAMAVGVQNGLGKFGAAAGTFLTEYLDSADVLYSVYGFILVAGVSCGAGLFMERETRGEELQDSRLHEGAALVRSSQAPSGSSNYAASQTRGEGAR